MTPFSDDQLAWLRREFDRCWPMIERAVKKMHEPYGRNYVWGRVADGTAQLFPGPASALLAEVNDAIDGHREFNIWLAGGDLDEVLKLASAAEKVGRDAGCTSIAFVGRLGFLRKPPEGYEATAVVMKKEL